MQSMRAMRIMHNFEFPFMPGNQSRRVRRARRVTVNEWEQGLLFRHGRLETVLKAGAHRLFRGGYAMRTVDMRPWVLLVPTQEVPTADGVPVKVTVAGQARVTDAARYVTAARQPEEAMYLAVQVALRDLVAGLSVEDLLGGRAEVGSRLQEGVASLEPLGLAIDGLDLKDIVLPRELKKAQAEVLVARAQGAAALERARGETAALRNLANAARMAADNPALVQLRLLQQLEASTGHTVVIGSPPFGSTPTA